MSALHRFFVGADAISDGRAALSGDQARQISDVLRLGPGDRIVLVRDGEELETELEAVGRSRVEGFVAERRPCAAEPRVRLTLALPLLRGDRSLEVVEAVTQLGVSRIVPFTSERSVVRELSAAKRARWERIAREAAETARRGRVPEVAPLVSWTELLKRLEAPIVVAWEQEKERTLRDVVPSPFLSTPSSLPDLSVVIGPEGGLSVEEISLARARGAVSVSLGARNLRSETAAIAAVAQVIALLG